MQYTLLPLTDDPRQVFTADVRIDGAALHARFEIRYLPAPDIWVISVWDHATEELLVNQIPLVCSYGELNDLFVPFRHLRDGRGMGSLFVLRSTDEPSTVNPSRGNLSEFNVLIGDTYDGPDT
ncbi:MAG: hypothetical protein K6E17_05805 [Clostridiales bacterium]|nr:hypothetical protein [Clostridiales bacterium]